MSRTTCALFSQPHLSVGKGEGVCKFKLVPDPYVGEFMLEHGSRSSGWLDVMILFFSTKTINFPCYGVDACILIHNDQNYVIEICVYRFERMSRIPS
jgi:hypothetical protein